MSKYVLEKMFKHNEYEKGTSNYKLSKFRKYTMLEKRKFKEGIRKKRGPSSVELLKGTENWRGEFR